MELTTIDTRLIFFSGHMGHGSIVASTSLLFASFCLHPYILNIKIESSMKKIINLIFNTFSVEFVISSCGSAAVGWLFFYGTRWHI
jgi:hypothetical protein